MSDEILWPKGTNKPEYDKLLEAAKKIAGIEVEIDKTKKIIGSNGDAGQIYDMPIEVLDGALGEICERTMLVGNHFPIAFAWPALLAVASTLVPRYNEKQHLNLFVALTGPVGNGKSQTIEAAQQVLGIEPPRLMSMMAGSAEALVRKCKSANGEPRLFSPDELGHLMEKAHIENASFPYVLNLAFYRTKFEVHMGKKEVAEFNASLSIIGGLVDERFEDLFSHATTAGLYDRFMFGACPTKFKFAYFPFEIEPEKFSLSSVSVSPEVWIEKERWKQENPELDSRIVEIAIRVATICASFDGKRTLTVDDLGPARYLAEYETKIRRYFKPNEGENPEAKIQAKLLEQLKRLGGREIRKRDLFHNCGAERCGLTIANRALNALAMNDLVYVTPPKERPTYVRLIVEDEDTSDV